VRLTKVIPEFIPLELAEKHANRMDSSLELGHDDHIQSMPDCLAWYGLHWDLLEECTERMSSISGLPLVATYDYSRIYRTGNSLAPHIDRPSCEVSVTLNLRSVGGKWEFCWDTGKFAMGAGDALVYTGCNVEHWREENPIDSVYQVFLHYVNSEGPYADRANEYMVRYPKDVTYRGD
jgi:hypothetical protein